MKNLFLVFSVIGATVFSFNANAKADDSDFIHLPLKCVFNGHPQAPDVPAYVSIERQGRRILGSITFNGDQANIICRRVPNQSFGHSLDCRGQWINDGSPTRFSASLNTYVPFVDLQLSQADFNGEKVHDICVSYR